jgi:hypothetical protein
MARPQEGCLLPGTLSSPFDVEEVEEARHSCSLFVTAPQNVAH